MELVFLVIPRSELLQDELLGESVEHATPCSRQCGIEDEVRTAIGLGIVEV